MDSADMLGIIVRRTSAIRSAFLLLTILGLAVGAAYSFGYLDDVSYVPSDHPAIKYFESPADDPVAQLESRLEKGQSKLEYDNDGWGYLPSVLHELRVNPDSQMLVFSKTSFQATRISPYAPRAIYFNDNVAVGFVQNGDVLEFVAQDSKLGMNFYTLDFHRTNKPGFARRDVCLQCHQGPATLGVPGIFISSVYPSRSGMPLFKGGATATDDRSPLDTRWGGWYVTGTTGSERHRGNAVASDPDQPQILETYGTQNVPSLEKKFDTAAYLKPTSDIVALMTYEHQTRMSNLITRIGWDTRIALYDHKFDDAMRTRLDSEIEEMVTYMLFADELRLREPISGVSTFTQTFPQLGPRDHQGRSLRDFDLKTRLFKYPLSYMIYSPAFDALPDEARSRVYQRLYDVLTGKDTNPKFTRLSADDRRNVLDILWETKPNLPHYWKAQNGG